MSTRSGKRIHNSLHENILKTDLEDVTKTERKTRNKRMKENVEELNVNIVKGKKRNNYVAYPTDDETGADIENMKEEEGKATRLRKKALKDRNTIAGNPDGTAPTDTKPKTRKTRKPTENTEDIAAPTQHEVTTKTENPKPKNKGKKKKKSDTNENGVLKKKTKKKKGRNSGSMIVEDIEPSCNKTSLNRSDMSVESFHSAAGSPVHDTSFPKENMAIEKLDSIEKVEDCPKYAEESPDLDDVCMNDDECPKPAEGRKTRSGKQVTNNVAESTRKRKSSVKVFDVTTEGSEGENVSKVARKSKMSVSNEQAPEPLINGVIQETCKSIINIDEGSDETTIGASNTEELLNTSKNINKRRTRSSRPDLIDDIDTENKRKSIKHNTTFDEITEPETESRNSIKNSTFEKESSFVDKKKSIINTTFEEDNTRRSSIKNTTFDKDSTEKDSTYEKIDLTLRKSSIISSRTSAVTAVNSTFEIEKKLDATFDKNSKSSLLSSDNDNNSNITFDKSDVRISITSDESSEHIVNTTPVLIESSMDESQIHVVEKTPSPKEVKGKLEFKDQTPSKNETPVKSATPIKTDLLKPDVPSNVQTPLKREGTFTKDEPEVPFSLRPSLKTPIKLCEQSPGRTPFPKSSSKEVMLNVTRSVEKSRRSSVADPQPRLTRVMFCSPVNNPAVVAQHKRKVIKSNLKGSNKSFVFDETVARPAARKRSYTLSDADEGRYKRKRLGEDLQHSVDRLSRPRTSSATAKLPDAPTPAKRQTPIKSKPEAKIPRTKLPNFAALHQKHFDKMESLDECQERKAKRAKQLLTPTGSVNIVERISPKEATTESKPDSKPAPKKPETPIKSLPTLKSLNPGFTRFGFKLNLDVNPFSVVSKTVSKEPKQNKPNGLRRQATLPSLTGTTGRRDVAKQTVMREKSFTERRNTKRTENRTVIKGVRTNRRFELQMRMRNVD